MLFITDGREQCKNSDEPRHGIANEELLNRVVEEKVRIITMAFG